VCSHTLSFEPDGEVEFYEGSISEYTRWKEGQRSRMALS
jgi:hypothetical protein